MLSVEGYAVWDRIHHTPHSEVYTGSRQADGLRVILKVYRGKAADSLARAQREFEMLDRIRTQGVVRAVELVPWDDRAVLVTERFPGFPLSRLAHSRRFGIAECLTIALSVTRSLAAVHEARVIHKDMKLSNILIDPERHETCLIDFGISAEFGRAERTAPPRGAEGTMRYIAPEQTGRLGLGIDFRTDLYSLGASLYELLAGQPPFSTKQGMELLSAHIALQPQPVVELDRSVPVALSRIVDKLLQKDPELRYQTARGLAADLEECQKQLLATGTIDEDLVLGTQDASDRLRFPHRLYGRDEECRALRAAFERVVQKHVELVLISGPPGIGKSSLPGSLRGLLAKRCGYLTEAKFDPDLRERPYSAFAKAFDSLIDQMLAESPERLGAWAEEIRAHVGAIGSVLVELAPGLRFLVPDFPPVPPLGAHEARERLALACVRFVHVVARTAHPLVLFLDDLQWADSGSLFLLSTILRSPEPEALLVIGGYRDGEVSPSHPLMRLREDLEARGLPVLHLPLPPLGLAETTAMLSDALGRSPAETEWLARRVGPKSQHNPLLIRRLVFHLWDRNLIRFEHGQGWVWDAELTEADITDDAAAMVAARIDALPPQARELIKVASLIGTAFEVEVLVKLADTDRLDALQQLMALVDQGLITPCREGFKFVHDRLREAAQSLLSAHERAALHHRAGQLLLERTSSEQLPALCFQIAEHLCGAIERLSEDERPRAIEILELAGESALGKGAPDTATHYLGLAQGLVRESDWQASFRLVFQVHLLRAEAAFQTRSFDHVLALVDGLLTRPLSPLQRALVLEQRIKVHAATRPEEAEAATREALRSFGVWVPVNPSEMRVRLGLRYTDWRLRGPLDETGLGRHPTADLDWIAPSIIVRAGGAALIRGGNVLSLCLVTTRLLLNYRRYGPVPGISLSFAAYAGMRVGILQTLRGTERYVRAAETWMERLPSAIDVRARFSLHCFTLPFLRPRRSLLEPLERIAERAREVGDPEYAAYTARHRWMSMALCGEPLESLLTDLEKLVMDTSDVSYRQTLAACGEAYGVLRLENAADRDWTRTPASIEHELEVQEGGDGSAAIHWIAVLCFFGQFERARSIGARFERVGFGTHPASEMDFLFFRSVCEGAWAAGCGRLARLRSVRGLKRASRAAARVGMLSPDYQHMFHTLRAECARLRGRTAVALPLYREAAQWAHDRAYRHHAALLHERRASLLVDVGRTAEARQALREAADQYQRWGALAKVRQLERQLEAEDPSIRTGTRKPTRVPR